MKIAIITANMGEFDKEILPVKQSIECDYFCFNNTNFPLRNKAMTPRLQARIPKCFGWQMKPNYDIYIWVDASCSLQHKDSVKWFLEHLNNVDAAFFKHPDRNSIKEEYNFLKLKLSENNKYLCSRYENELLDEQLNIINQDNTFVDNFLCASTAFIYKNKVNVHDMLTHWWYHISRYHIIDQLALPYVIMKSKCSIKIIDENYLKIQHLTYTRNKKWKT